MSGIPHQILTEPLTSDLLSLLRHELVSPINLIVGYCELLMAEATDREDSSPLTSLQSIRQCGLVMLGAIDRVLLTNVHDRSLADIVELAQALIVPAAQLVECCGAILKRGDGLIEAEFATDVDRIRSAGRRMCLMAQDLAMGIFPQADASSI